MERSLWAGQQVPSVLNLAGQDQRVSWTLAAIGNLQLQEFDLFGTTNRLVDFSHFEVRGHYTTSERLSRYFQAMMWCGRIDLRLATFPPNQEDDIRQLGTAVVLNCLLNQSGQFNNWSAIEEITRTFVGPTDSMTFGQLGHLLAAADIQSPADVADLLTLTNPQTQLLLGELGVQSIPRQRHQTLLVLTRNGFIESFGYRDGNATRWTVRSKTGCCRQPKPERVAHRQGYPPLPGANTGTA